MHATCSSILAVTALLVASHLPQALANAQTTLPAPTDRDGQHDFDFLIGSWKLHLKRLTKPLTGSTDWEALDGTVNCRRVWDGKANMEEVVLDGQVSHAHIQGLTLRLYNPTTHQWSLYWANAADGSLPMPPTVGHFDGKGRGEFYDREDYRGRPIVVRYVWSNITATSAHFEEAFSADDGKTWEVNWITDQTRVTAEPKLDPSRGEHGLAWPRRGALPHGKEERGESGIERRVMSAPASISTRTTAPSRFAALTLAPARRTPR